MKRFVDLRGPRSLDEAVSLATQFESFKPRENSTGLNSQLEAKGKHHQLQFRLQLRRLVQ